jgi:hypothetical protein
MLPPREYDKLCHLAVDRAYQTISLITESLDNDEQSLGLTVIVLAALHDTTALQMLETARLPDGSKLSFNDCRSRILAAVISGKVADAMSDLKFQNAQPLQ